MSSFIDLDKYKTSHTPGLLRSLMDLIVRLRGQTFTVFQLHAVIQEHDDFVHVRGYTVSAVRQALRDIKRHHPQFGLETVKKAGGRGVPAVYQRRKKAPDDGTAREC